MVISIPLLIYEPYQFEPLASLDIGIDWTSESEEDNIPPDIVVPAVPLRLITNVNKAPFAIAY